MTLLFIGILFLWVHNRLYLIPSNSMQPLLSPGDVVWLNQTQSVDRNDVVIFFSPEADSAYEKMPAVDYYEHVRVNGRARSLHDTAEFGKPVYVPVRYRQPYIKRCVGLPGDTLQLINEHIILNHRRVIAPDSVSRFSDHPADHVCDAGSFEQNRYEWRNQTNGPVVIPGRGVTIRLTPCNLAFYYRIISSVEKNSLEIVNHRILINHEEKRDYTFQQNYYFVLGDNRNDSRDSRAWGFVPEDCMIGKTSFVAFSLETEESGKCVVSWRRILKVI